MESEEAVEGVPEVEHGLPLFEEMGKPGVGADVGIEGAERVGHHPEHGAAAACLPEGVATGGVVHLFDGELSVADEGLKEGEVVGTAGVDHPWGGHDEVGGIARVVGVEWSHLQLAVDHADVEAYLEANSL